MAEQRFCKPQVDLTTQVCAESYSDSSAPPTYTPTSCTPTQPDDSDLQEIIAAWPALPAALRRAMLALVDAVSSVTGTETPAGDPSNGGFGDERGSLEGSSVRDFALRYARE